MIDASDLHRSLLTIDTHIDIPFPDGPNFFQDGKRKVDLPKMKRGQLAAGCFAAYIAQGLRTPDAYKSAVVRTTAMLRAINAMGATNEGARVCVTADEINKAHDDGVTIVVPCVENGQSIGGDVANLAIFYDLGARYLTLTHFGHNALADSSNPRADLADVAEEHGGLSDLGRSVVGELNRLGMLVDIAHTSKKTMMQSALLSRTPVLSTHSCIKALCDNARNVDDEQLDMLAQVGGVVQVTAVPAFLKTGGKADTVTVADYCDHVDYAVKRIGIAHVGISSDFDGGGGFVGWFDASESANITSELVQRGYGASDIAALWGGNFMRLLRLAEARKGTA
ncbi:MAG: membrane dipeptidase [Acetobacteraceae bacterium]|nr:membrane dipeptidase [Acetobacteraceae bacterium]